MDKLNEEIKIITIGIEEVPKGFCNPVWLKAKPNRVKVSEMFTDGLDITTMEDTNIRMEYPLTHFLMEGNIKPFYIREKDKKAFEELLQGHERYIIEKFADYMSKHFMNEDDTFMSDFQIREMETVMGRFFTKILTPQKEQDSNKLEKGNKE